MEKRQHGFLPILCIVTSLGLFSAASCIAAELKRHKVKDLKLDGRLCYLPESHSFRFGIAALICLCIAQIVGNLFVWRSGDKTSSCKAKKPAISTLLLFISWISFGIAVLLLGSATSMSRRQPYGKGWLDSQCYLVKDGVFIGSAILVLLTLGSTLALLALRTTRRKTQVDQEFTVQEQLDPKF